MASEGSAPQSDSVKKPRTFGELARVILAKDEWESGLLVFEGLDGLSKSQAVLIAALVVAEMVKDASIHIATSIDTLCELATDISVTGPEP
jgi:hypothetical protein